MVTKTIPIQRSFLENEAVLALNYFQEKKIPTTRQENWRFSNLKPWHLPDTTEPAKEIEFSEDEFSQFTLADTYSVFILNDQIHIPREFPESVFISSFQSAVGQNPFKDTFGKIADYHCQTLAAENTAQFTDGLFIQIFENKIIDIPIHLIHIVNNQSNGRIFPRVLVHAGANSQAEILESEVGLDENQHFINSVSEICIQENANLQWTKIQQLNSQSGQWASINVALESDSAVQFNNFDFGGGFVRNEVHNYLQSPGANFELNSLFVPDGKQHMDTFSVVYHKADHCSSRQLIKGALGGNSSGVFRGLAHVYPEAQKTDAQQTNHNLLLSSKAVMNSIPQLEIYEDDVKCSHGSTTGQLDEDAIFYLRSRGINAIDASALLVKGFAREIVDKLKLETFKNLVQTALNQKLERILS